MHVKYLIVCVFNIVVLFKMISWINGCLIFKCIRIKDENNLVARRHYEIINFPA